jgi:hypothetical protein
MLEFDRRSQELRLPPVPQEPIRFASKAERACGLMLEKYVKDFQLIPGATFQVGVGHNKTIDFRINGVFVEYHPIVLHQEFNNRGALHKLFEASKQVKPHVRNVILDSIKAELAEKYYLRRKFLVTMAAGKDAELIVCYSARDFYCDVLERFGTNVPKEQEALFEFQTLCRQK